MEIVRKSLVCGPARAESPTSPKPRATPWVPCPPFPTPCKGKSKSQPFAHTFALTGRGRLYTDTQGVALGCGLAALSGRSFSRFVRFSCAHALPLVVWQKNRAENFLYFEHPTPKAFFDFRCQNNACCAVRTPALA